MHVVRVQHENAREANVNETRTHTHVQITCGRGTRARTRKIANRVLVYTNPSLFNVRSRALFNQTRVVAYAFETRFIIRFYFSLVFRACALLTREHYNLQLLLLVSVSCVCITNA